MPRSSHRTKHPTCRTFPAKHRTKWAPVGLLGLFEVFEDFFLIFLKYQLVLRYFYRVMQSFPYRFRAMFSLVLFFVAAFSSAQSGFHMERISIEQGLSQGMVFDLLQDKEGFLWIATKDGLNRYDGYEFKVFTNDPYNPFSLSSNTVVTLFEDSMGRIWVGTENAGLNVYDKRTGRFFRIQHRMDDATSLSGNQIACIQEAGPNQIIVTVLGKELNVLDLPDDFFEKNTAPQIRRVALPNNAYASGIAKDGKGQIWVSTNGSVYRFEPLNGSLSKVLEGFSFETWVANPDGSIWAAGMKQAPFLWDGKSAQLLPVNMGDIRKLALDSGGALWVADQSGVTKCLMPRSPAPKFIQEIIPCASMLVDRSGVIWIGTGGFGLRKINPLGGRFQHEEAGTSIRRIVSFAGKPLSLGYEKTGTGASSQHRPSVKILAEMFPNKLIDNVLAVKSGEFWARAEDLDFQVSLNRYSPKDHAVIGKYTFKGYYWDATPMLEDSKNQIWMAGYGGHLICFDPANGDTTAFDFSASRAPLSPSSPSTALYEDAEGRFWIGTTEGFARATPQSGNNRKLSFEWYRNNPNDRNSLSYNHVACFLDDPVEPKRFLWICTKGGGLNRLDKKSGQFLHLNTVEGLPNNVVYGLLPDAAGNLWGSTNRGLFLMSHEKKGNDEQLYHFRNFTKADGLQDEEFNTGAYSKLNDGRLAFGGVNGLNVFDPATVLLGDYVPRTFITNIWVNNQPIAPIPANDILQQTIETTESIKLTHQQGILTLEFAALDFTAPGQNKYRYQLIGADPDWVESGTRRQVNYLYLPAGNYTFRVQGSNSKGIWSKYITELKIKVLPPWWRSWWAYFVYVLLLAAGTRTYFRFSLNRAKLKAQLAYETREAGRVKELDLLKTQLYTNITHEFRTPLTVILGMVQQMRDNPTAYLDKGIEMIQRNAQSLLKLVNDMLQLAKLESGKMTLQPVQGDLIAFLRYISESFQSLAESRHNQLHFLSDLDSLIIEYDPEKLQLVVSNLLANALKFTPQGGQIYFTVSFVPSNEGFSTLFLKVKDTGIGIPETQLPHVFDRFFQADNSNTRQSEGTGIGLALTKELLKLMDGEIRVKSPPSGAKKGTEFVVTLPVRRSVAIITPDTTIEMRPSLPIEPTIKIKLPSLPSDLSYNIHHQSLQESPLVMLVEDNSDVVAYIAACLIEYRVAVGVDGQEGLDIATQIIPDLIISDVMMPVIDGFELCRRLKTDERTSHIPIILLTAKADMGSKLEGLELGADAYLEKPFHKEELLVRIKKLLELRGQLQQYYLKKAGLTEGAIVFKDIPRVDNIADAFVQKVKASVEAHLDDVDFNVEQLCREVHLSQSQLQRKLDALTGFSPNQLIRNIRLNKAKELLRNPELSITAVAYDCGFNDPSYFGRVFKQEFGTTPQEWREKLGNIG